VAPTTITINLPSGMSAAADALNAAVTAWNNRLGGTGVQLTVGSCNSGPHCIPISVNPLIATCGASRPADTDSTGTITGNAGIDLTALGRRLAQQCYAEHSFTKLGIASVG
jgi:hypothetical protein